MFNLLKPLPRRAPVQPNLASPNQRSGGNALSSSIGFGNFNGGSDNYSLDVPIGGLGSIKIVTSGDAHSGNRLNPQISGLQQSTIYTVYLTFYTSSPIPLSFLCTNGDQSAFLSSQQDFISNGGLQTVKMQINTGIYTTLDVILRKNSDTTIRTFYIGGLIVRKGTY